MPLHERMKIALIDDEQMILDLYTHGLAKEFEVLTAINGIEGLDLIEHEKPNLALVDLQMPQMDGIQMLKKMREQGINGVPVIVLTNIASDDKIAEAIELGAKEYVLKESVTPEQLIERIKPYLK